MEFHRHNGRTDLLPAENDVSKFPDRWVRGRRLDLANLYRAVQRRGGFRAAPEAEQMRLHWGNIFAEMDNYMYGDGVLPPTSYLLEAYQHFLAQYEAAHMDDAEGTSNIYVQPNGENLPAPGTRIQIFYEPELNWFPATVGASEGRDLCWLYYDGGEIQMHRLSQECLRLHPRSEDARQPVWSESHPAVHIVPDSARTLPGEPEEAAEALCGVQYSTRNKYYSGWRVAQYAHDAGLPQWLINTLEAHEVDLDTLPFLTDEDLFDMGIDSPPVRAELLASIQKAVQNHPPESEKLTS